MKIPIIQGYKHPPTAVGGGKKSRSASAQLATRDLEIIV